MICFSHFCSREAANIDGLGFSTISELFDYGYIASIADLFTLHDNVGNVTDVNNDNTTATTANSTSLYTKKGWGVKSVTKLLNSIDKCKSIPFNKYVQYVQYIFVYSLPLDTVYICILTTLLFILYYTLYCELVNYA
jgi:NAD-dependent DNA ligase